VLQQHANEFDLVVEYNKYTRQTMRKLYNMQNIDDNPHNLTPDKPEYNEFEYAAHKIK